jgi:hypothetical protein
MQIEISRRILPVKRTRILVTVLAALALLLSSCGTSDKVASVSITAVNGSGGGFENLAGIGGTLQLQVMANYTSGKQVDETNWSTYTVTPFGTDDSVPGIPLPSPPQTVTINATGMMTAVQPAYCTWINLNTPAQPAWFLTGYYSVTAKYHNFTSQPIFIGVASAAPSSGTQCGPS